MARSLDNERSVVSILSDAGYYPTDGGSREELQAQYVEEEQVDIGGKSYTLSKISKYDVKLFGDQLDRILRRLNPFIQDIFAINAVQCLAAMRLANINSKQGFRGFAAKGNELDFSLMNAREFYNPDSSTNARTSWVRTVGSVGDKNFIEGATAGAALTLGEEECHIYLGWYNPSVSPCVDAIQNTLNTDSFDVQDVDFEIVNDEMGEPIIEYKTPFIIPPEEAYEIHAYYYRTGTDEMRPIGLYFREAKNKRLLVVPTTLWLGAVPGS